MQSLQFKFGWSVVLVLVGTPSVSFAYGEHSGSLSQGVGIAATTPSGAMEENPAGLIQNHSKQLTGLVRSNSSSFDPLTFGGVFTTGNGQLGGGIGYLSHGGTPSTSDLLFGLATHLPSLGVTFGVNGTYRLTSGGSADFNLGAMFHPHGSVRVGMEIYSLRGGPDGYGLGAAYMVSQEATLGIDGTANKDFKGLSVKPSLKISSQGLGLMVGYGIRVSTDAPMTHMINDLSLGASYELNQAILRAYFEQTEKYGVEVGFRI